MLDDDIVTVPAGWYPDPMGLPQLRWWDNYAWTEFTSAARTPLIVQDEPKLAYADDDLPSRRSQRAQRENGDVRRPAANTVNLASTLRQLEPPKPQNIERNQPAPEMATSTPDPQPFAEPQSAHGGTTQTGTFDPDFDPFADFLAEPVTADAARVAAEHAAAERARADQRFADQRFAEQQAQAEQAAQANRAEQTTYANPSAYADPYAAGYGQPQAAAQFANQQNFERDQFTAAADSHRQQGFAPSRAGMHAPLAYTPFVWIIAMIPLIQLVGILLVVSAVDVAMALPFLLVIAGAPYIVTIPLAYADRKQLLRTGHQHPAHWAWSILTGPAYLIARAIAASREHGKGLTPLLVWAGLSLLQVASIIAVPGILISAMPAVFSAEAAQSIEADSLVAGRELAVDCPTNPPVQIGGTFNCTGVLNSTGEEVGIVVRLQRANGWIDWRVYGMVWENSTTGTAPASEDVKVNETEGVLKG